MQNYVEDCQVCQANLLSIRFDPRRKEFVMRAVREN